MTKLRYDYETGYCGELLRDDGTTLCAFDTEPTAADARRLVACWNACDGIDTKYLEGDDSLPHYARRLMAQRDELLAALIHAVEIAEDKRPGTWDDLLQYRAIINKTTKGQA